MVEKGMTTNSPNATGHQLTSAELHKRQQEQVTRILAPTVIVVGVTDPANIGSIFRICDAVKCKQIIFVDATDISIRKIKRISRSTTEMVSYQCISTDELVNSIGNFPELVAIEITSKSTDVYATPLSQDIAFVIGGERYGIPEHILELCAYAVHIPMFGINSSMNVATSLGIVLYEWHRRFRTSQGGAFKNLVGVTTRETQNHTRL